MKAIQILAVVILTVSCAVDRQKGVNDNAKVSKSYKYKPFKKFKGDTTMYLKENFEVNKQAYIGQKVSVLLNKLELKVIDCTYMGMHQDFTKTNLISLGFYNNDEASKRVLTNQPIDFVHITFEKLILISDLENLNKETGSRWSDKHSAYLGDMVIKDLDAVSFPSP